MSGGVDWFSADCPYCGECIELWVESAYGQQSYVEDCQVCCQPMTVTLQINEAGAQSLSLRRDDD